MSNMTNDAKGQPSHYHNSVAILVLSLVIMFGLYVLNASLMPTLL